VNGRAADMPLTLDFPQRAEDRNSPIPIIWARTQIADNMRLIGMPPSFRPAGMTDDILKNKVTDLGLAFNLVTRWTSFVAVSTQVVNQHPDNNEDANVPLPMVKGVGPKAYGSPLQQIAEFSGGSVPEPSEIAGMILIAGIGAYGLWRWRRRQQYHALLYAVAASAWMASCSTES
jgi:Ca-activated chloride channel family protein